MRRLSVLIVLFVGFSVMNGYGFGSRDKTPPPAPAPTPAPVNHAPVNPDPKLETIGRDIETIKDTIVQVKNRLDTLENPGQGSNLGENGSADEPRFIPINLAIINKHKENLGELDYFVSKDINLTILGSEKNSIIVQDRILKERIDKPRSEDKLEISKNDPGKFWNFSATPTGRESMEIFFSDKPAILTFTRNRNKNNFELTSARKDGKEIDLDDETVQLYIKYKGNRLTLTTDNTAADNERQERIAPVAKRDRAPAISRDILLERGQGYLTQDAVVDYMQKHSRSSHNISAIVSAYFKIAKEEGVNHEIAIAQMWYATRALSHDALLRNCNYAGLVKSRTFDGTFNGIDMGVRAHIQHLKGYASKDRPKNIVDPRYQILVTNGYLGKGDTLEKLSAYWSQSKEYEANIVIILEDMYQHQYQYNSRL